MRPQQRGSNELAGIELGQHGAIQRQLTDIGSRHILESLGGRTIGFVVGDQDRIGDDGKLTFARKYDIDVGDKTMFWMGMVPL